MTTDLNRLAKTLDLSAPDAYISALLIEEREKIEEALRTVGEYVLSDESGRIYVITASDPNFAITECSPEKTSEKKAATASANL